MKLVASVLVSTAMMVSSAAGQIPKQGFGDKGCPEKSLFVENGSISGSDFIEVRQLPSYDNGPVYTVRVYADGRMVWHGEAKVSTVGDASGVIDPLKAKALIAGARELGFGKLCDEYAMHAFDGGISVTRLGIGGQVKVVTNIGPSNAPSWLYKLHEQIAALDPVQKLIGVKQDQPRAQK